MRADKRSPYRLLVEGQDDEHSIFHLLDRHGFAWEREDAPVPYIERAGGLDNVLEAIPTALKNQRRLGVVLDGDLDPGGRWEALCDRTSRVGVRLPAEPELSGTIVPSTQPGWLAGVWLMPDNRASGTLEDFLTRLVPTDDPCMTHASAATSTARALGAPLRDADHTKGALHAWLAWQRDPGLPFGVAIRTRVLTAESDEARSFVAWFKRLFDVL